MFKKYYHKANLVYANQGNISVNGSCSDLILSFIREIQIENNLFSDKVYKNLLKEYNKHYQIYDIAPFLLYCKIPIIFHRTFGRKHDLIMKESYIKPTIHKLRYKFYTIPDRFRIPQHTLNVILTAMAKSIPYMAESKKPEEGWRDSYSEWIQFSWLKEWDYFYFNKGDLPSRISAFSVVFFDDIINRGEGENQKVIANVIERYLKTVANEVKMQTSSEE